MNKWLRRVQVAVVYGAELLQNVDFGAIIREFVLFRMIMWAIRMASDR